MPICHLMVYTVDNDGGVTYHGYDTDAESAAVRAARAVKDYPGSTWMVRVVPQILAVAS